MAAYISFQPSDFFSTNLWTGTGVDDLTPTGVGFSSAFTWMKKRDGADNYALYDTARGATKRVMCNEPDPESTITTGLKSWTSDGFVLGTDAEGNANTKTYVGWNWKGGTTSGITTDGSTTITPSAYSFNQTSGFSALAYTGNATSGANLAHGLGVAPEMVIVKNLIDTVNWSVYHKDMETSSPEDWQIQLDTDSASTNNATMWNDTAPDAVNMVLGNGGNTNGSSDDMVAYCFTGKKGYSKFGYYYGNGNADGTFVHTGFRPAFILIKRNHATGNWQIFDDKRLGYNGGNSYLSPNDTAVENTGGQIDILSNGFKMRNTGTYTNASLSTYIYAAFAEFPFVSSNSKATVAR